MSNKTSGKKRSTNKEGVCPKSGIPHRNWKLTPERSEAALLWVEQVGPVIYRIMTDLKLLLEGTEESVTLSMGLLLTALDNAIYFDHSRPEAEAALLFKRFGKLSQKLQAGVEDYVAEVAGGLPKKSAFRLCPSDLCTMYWGFLAAGAFGPPPKPPGKSIPFPGSHHVR